MSVIRLSIIAIGVSCVFSASAFASQEATVASPHATIYDFVAGQTKSLATVNQGQVIMVADHPKGSWYRCMIPNSAPPKSGWIQVRDVTIGAVPSAPAPNARGISHTSSSSNSSSDLRPSVELLFDLAFPTPSNLQTAAGLVPGLSVGSSIAGQFLYPLSPRLRVGARAELVLIGGQLSVTSPAAETLSYSGLALPINAVGEFMLVSQPKFALGIFAGAGVSPVTRVSISTGSGTSTASTLSFSAPVGVDAEISLGKRLMLVIEAGYQLIKPLSSSSLTIGNDLSAPIAGAGLGLRL